MQFYQKFSKILNKGKFLIFSDFIAYEQLEPYLLKVIREKEYEPDEPEILMSAFKLMDPDNKVFYLILGFY